MAGTHLISGSFIQSGSVAQFKGGVSSSKGLRIDGVIKSDNFNGISIANNSTPLNVGKANDNGTFEEWETQINQSIRITASGNFDTFCFIENNNNKWETVSKGESNGLFKKSHHNAIYSETGIYEYLIIATNISSKKTVIKGTTVTVN
jgi:hypothetical protein|tara:strand:+ start:2054 stop:2497 length:444 start_codon:yes stop_codon:yes gene_type:complete